MEPGGLLSDGNGLTYLPLFMTSLALGLLIGLERERSPAAKAGLRTFALTALLGTLLAMLAEKTGSPWLLAGGLVAVGAMIISAYLDDNREEDPGTTTQAALLLCFGLGAMVWHGYATMAVMIAIVITILLHYKPELQSMSKNLSRGDVQSILQFAVLSFIILPILPDLDYGPNETLNPYQTWLMVVLISGLSLAGYVALRWFGQRHGAPLLGVFGGLASSTATTLVYARYGRDNAMLKLAAVVILIANLVVLVRLSVVSGVVAAGLLPSLLPVLAGGFVLGGGAIFWMWRSMSAAEDLPIPQTGNPTEIRTALGFGLLYALVLFAAAWLSNFAGSGGLYLLALVSGLTDVDAIALSCLRLFEQGKLAPEQAVTTIVIAYLSNLLFKLGVVFVIGGRALARSCTPGMGAAAIGLIIPLALSYWI